MQIPEDDRRSATGEPELRVTCVRGAALLRRMRLRSPFVVAAAVAVAAAATGIGLTATGALSSSAIRQPGGVRVASATPMSPVPFSSGGPGAGAAASASAASGTVACPMIPAVPDVTGVSAGTTLGSATHLFTRTTTDGVTIRVYRLPSTEPCTCDPPPVSSPPSGPSSGSGSSGAQGSAAGSSVSSAVSVEFSDKTAIGQGVLFDEPSTETSTPAGTSSATEPSGGTSGAFGVAEGTPVWWIAVSVGPEVTRVQVAFADGSTDQMSPIGGVAVLAHQINPSVATAGDGPYEVRGTLQLLGASGAVIDTVTFPEPAPTPTPVPEPMPAPGTPPETVPGSTSSTPPTTASSIPTVVSPPATSRAMVACPEMLSPPTVSAG